MRILTFTPHRPGRAVAPALVTLVVLAASTVPAPAGAADVVVLRGSDVPAYKAVDQSFSADFTGPRSVSLATAGVDVKAELAGARLVLAIGPDAARAALAAQAGAPVLVALATETELAGAKPAAIVPMFVPPARQLKLARLAMPSLTRVGVLYDPAKTRAMVADCEAAAKAAGITLEKVEVASRAAVIEAARALTPKVDAVWLLPDSTVIGLDSFKVLVATTVAAKVGLIGFSEGMARTGTVVAVEATYPEIGRRAAAAGKRLLAGSPAAPEAPEGTLFVNAKTAELIGLELPQAARTAAAKVFE